MDAEKLLDETILISSTRKVGDKTVMKPFDVRTNDAWTTDHLNEVKMVGEAIYIRYGQIDVKNEGDEPDPLINGLGRKIRLWPVYSAETNEITSYTKELCYIKEGQFEINGDDELNGFARAVFGDGSAYMGWVDSGKIHGYA